MGENLKKSLDANRQPITEMRIMDLGAGNGMMGEVLRKYGVSRLVGADIIPEAKDAAYRDRPGVYDEYYVEDFCALSPETRSELEDWSIDCLTSVAALGFDDIPVNCWIHGTRSQPAKPRFAQIALQFTNYTIDCL